MNYLNNETFRIVLSVCIYIIFRLLYVFVNTKITIHVCLRIILSVSYTIIIGCICIYSCIMVHKNYVPSIYRLKLSKLRIRYPWTSFVYTQCDCICFVMMEMMLIISICIFTDIIYELKIDILYDIFISCFVVFLITLFLSITTSVYILNRDLYDMIDKLEKQDKDAYDYIREIIISRQYYYRIEVTRKVEWRKRLYWDYIK